jgi:imidazolonepropionase-like amidohydrolase
VIDGQGAYAMPGLAEMHAHVPGADDGEQRAKDVLALYLANGITTARGMLGEPWHLEVRALLADGRWPGPRLVTSGPSFNGRTVTSPAQAAGRVREQVEAGYDFLKLHPGLEADEYEAIVEAAREAGIPFAGHVSEAVGLDAALRARQDSIDHLDGYAQAMVPEDTRLHGESPQFFGVNLAPDIDAGRADALAYATALAGVWNVPTQSLLEHAAGDTPVKALLDRPEMAYVSSGLATRWSAAVMSLRNMAAAGDRVKFLAARRALIRALHEAQAGLLLGSDAPQIMNVPGFSIHHELAFLVEAGLTPLEALRTGTVEVARFFGETDRGLVAEGHVADMVLLGANPVQTIGATRDIRGVMRAGRWHSRADLDALLADIRKRPL